MSWNVLTSLLGCVAQWCLLVFVSFQSRRTRFARVLSALCAMFLAWTYAAAAFQATGDVVWHWLDLGVSPFVPPLGLGLVIAFTGGGRRQWLAWLLVWVAFTALAATGWAALWWVPARRWVASDGWPLVYLAFFLPTIALSLALLAHYRRLHVSAHLEVSRGRWLFWGIAIGAALALTELFADLGFRVPRLGHVASLTTSLIVTWLGLGRGLLERPTGVIVWLIPVGAALLIATGATMLVLFDRGEALSWGAVVLGLSTCAGLVAGTWHTSALQHARQRRMALMGRMSAQLAHDLRNPLAAIVGAVDVLEVEEGSASGDDETRERMLRLIRQQADRMGALTSRYVSMTKVQGAEAQAVSLPALVHGAWDAAGVRRPAPEIPRWKAWVDGALLGAALQNLLANAVDAAETEVTLLVSRVGNDLIFQIADDGPGLNPRDIELIREGFYTTKAAGSGLGVSFAIQVARAHGGTLDLISQLGEGTQARLVLPGALAGTS